MVFYLIGAQLINKNEQQTWQQIQTQVIQGSFGNNGHGKLLISDKEKFRLGNLDQLMFINDQIIKQETYVESLLKKIERQYQDTDENLAVNFKVNNKDGVFSLERYLQDFNWDDLRFPRNQNLQSIVKEIQNRVMNIETDLRQKTNQVQETKSAFNQLSKKDGSILNKDLIDVLKEPIVSASDFVNSTYIQTYVLILQKSQIELLCENYLYLSENVIPNSLKRFNYEDKEGYTLWSIKLLKIPLIQGIQNNPLEEFIKNCKDKLKISVREYNFVQGESQKKDMQRIELETKTQSLITTLRQSCEQSYSDLYVSYIHLKYLRFLVESIMRFGTQEKYMVSIIKPSPGKEKKVQQSLLKLFNDSSVYGTKEELEDSEDFFPFIYIPINIY